MVRDVRSKGNKHFVVGEVTGPGECVSEAGRRREFVAKLYSSDRGLRAHTAMLELWEAGFRAPSPYRVAQPFGYAPEVGTLLQARAEGASWAAGLAGPRDALEHTSRLAGQWLLALQDLAPRGPAHSLAIELARVERCTAELMAAFPDQAPRLAAVARALHQRLADDRGPAVPAHGDYHPSNVFVAQERVTVIDFDTYAPRPAAFDVGYAIGQLLIMSFLTTGRSRAGAVAGRAFWSSYTARGLATWPAVAAQVARTLVQSLHYELCTFRTGRVDLLAPWLDGMDAWLGAAGAEVFDAPLGAAEGGRR